MSLRYNNGNGAITCDTCDIIIKEPANVADSRSDGDYCHKCLIKTRATTHDLKVLTQYYKAVISGKKTFELRKLDRDYRNGDLLRLREYDGEDYTGQEAEYVITYVLTDAAKYGLMDGFCILGIKRI